MTPREVAAVSLERAGMLTRAKAIRGGESPATAIRSLTDCLEAVDVRGDAWGHMLDALVACCEADRGDHCEHCGSNGCLVCRTGRAA